MESVADFLCAHAPHAHLVLFLLILSTGFNFPLPEDILVITGGVLVSTCVPEHYALMFGWLYAGAIFSAYEAYWIGRLLGPRLYDIHYFHHVITRPRVQKIGHLLERFGVWTFLIGRFMPFGVRNGIFMTSGLSKMPFYRFMLRDGIGALLATWVLFNLGYEFGDHYQLLIHYLHTYQVVVIAVVAMIAAGAGLLIWYRRRKMSKRSTNEESP